MKRPILLACLSMAALLWSGLPFALAAPPSPAAPPATMTGESFVAVGGTGPDHCSSSGGTFSFSASGVATGPYPGTFTETGAATENREFFLDSFSADFTIYSASGDVLVTGSKHLDPSLLDQTACVYQPGNAGEMFGNGTIYNATIFTATGNYRDQGTSVIPLLIADPAGTSLNEDFVSSLTEPILIVPTSKDQCKNGGWQKYPQFKNQGECVRFVSGGG